MKKELLRMDHVTVVKGGELFLDNLNFQMYTGEIMGLIAREDKGCDRLIDLICHNNPIDYGIIWFSGRVVNRYSYSNLSDNRVYVIEQKSHLVEALSVADNIFVLRKGFKKYLINEKTINNQASRFLHENSISIDLRKRVEALTELERCQIEIAKALLIGCRLIIIDNPGNYLSQHELPLFQSMLRHICDEGVAVLYISNHHQEVFKIADRTSLFASGQIKKIFDYNEMTDQAMVPYIIDFKKGIQQMISENEDGVMHFHSVYTENLHGLNFVIHKGECLTILDMDNKIFSDIQGIMTGTLKCSSGRITVDHGAYNQVEAVNYLDKGVAIIAEDATHTLLFRNQSYMENLTFLLDKKLGKSLIGRNIYKSIYNEYKPLVGKAIDVQNINKLELIDLLALVYYRNHIFHPKILICIQPLARGDMYCRMRVLELIREFKKSGIAVLILTTNISDTLEVADRIIIVEGGNGAVQYHKDEFDFIVR